ncbi:unnamed protein product [Brassica napus]|uniref:(rape) hypothetical protein n=1 Tax=Brassica napus TaxID=3708 RepID=A0A816JJT9_BRANA|nr:unnamed protein product [Brassica napus]
MPNAATDVYHKLFLNNSNKQSMETPSEAFVASTLYEVEEDRVGVPLLSEIYEVLWKLGLRSIPLCSPLL